MNNLKASYEALSFEIEKLYTKKFNDNDTRGIEAHCEYIADLIEAAGWSVQEYMEEYVHRGLKEFFPNLKDMN